MLELLDGKSVHGCCYRRVTRGGGRGEVSPALFQKLEKSALILEKNALIVSILGLISHFKCGFKSFQERKKHIFLPVGLFLHVLWMKCLSTCPDSEKTPLPWNIPGYAPVLELFYLHFGETFWLKTFTSSILNVIKWDMMINLLS